MFSAGVYLSRRRLLLERMAGRLEDDVLVTETGARRVGKFHQFKKWSIKIFLASE